MNELLALCLRTGYDPTALAAVAARARDGGIDWDALMEQVQNERVGPLLHCAFSQAAFVPVEVASSWQRDYRAASLFYVIWSAGLARVGAALARERIPFIVLKGAALAETVYAKPALRPLADIDLLVPRERVAITLEVLEANGYLPPPAAESEDYLLAFENELAMTPRNPVGVSVDVHWSLFDSPYYQRTLAHDWFWESSVPLPGYGSARMLGAEAQLLHLSAHLMVHHHGRGALWLYDVVELLRWRGSALDWDRVAAEAQRGELVLSLQRTLDRAVDELGAFIAPEHRARLAQLRASAAEHRVFDHPTIGTRSPEHFWNDVVTLPDWRTRAAYVAQRALPSPAFMRQRYQIRRSAWLPVYYPYRWLLAVWRLLETLASRACAGGRA